MEYKCVCLHVVHRYLNKQHNTQKTKNKEDVLLSIETMATQCRKDQRHIL